MYRALITIGAVLLILSFIWGYLWFEVLRDPKNELQSLHSQHPTVHKAILILNKAWLPNLVLGVALVATSLLLLINSSA